MPTGRSAPFLPPIPPPTTSFGACKCCMMHCRRPSRRYPGNAVHCNKKPTGFGDKGALPALLRGLHPSSNTSSNTSSTSSSSGGSDPNCRGNRPNSSSHQVGPGGGLTRQTRGLPSGSFRGDNRLTAVAGVIWWWWVLGVGCGMVVFFFSFSFVRDLGEWGIWSCVVLR